MTVLDVDFSDLRSAITSLQHASAKLDTEKATAEKKLRKLLRRFAVRHLVRRNLHRALCRLRKLVGKECSGPHAHAHGVPPAAHMEKTFECSAMKSGGGGKSGLLPFKPRVGHAPALLKEHHAHGHEYGMKPRFPAKRFRKAAQRVRAVNQKLKAFERGFIHEDGIKDREWYRNLDIAPGKWLGKCYICVLSLSIAHQASAGYGATTFPALTESFTIEKNATMARYEAKRLQKLIEKLAHEIKV